MNVTGLVAYAALGLPLAMAMLPIYMISPKFYGDGLGVDLAALGAILFLTRMFDTVQDPFLGRVVDKFQRKRHGWLVLMLASGLILAVGFVLLFTPPRLVKSGSAWLAGNELIVGVFCPQFVEYLLSHLGCAVDGRRVSTFEGDRLA